MSDQNHPIPSISGYVIQPGESNTASPNDRGIITTRRDTSSFTLFILFVLESGVGFEPTLSWFKTRSLRPLDHPDLLTVIVFDSPKQSCGFVLLVYKVVISFSQHFMRRIIMFFELLNVRLTSLDATLNSSRQRQIDLPPPDQVADFHLREAIAASPPIPATIPATTATTAKIPRTIARGIHSGLRTHSQGHAITPPSLRPMNRIARRPPKLIPPEPADA